MHLVGFIIIIPALCILLFTTDKKTPDDGQRNCPKHVEFYSKNKFEKLVRLVGFIIRIAAMCILLFTTDKKTPDNGQRNCPKHVGVFVYTQTCAIFGNKLIRKSHHVPYPTTAPLTADILRK